MRSLRLAYRHLGAAQRVAKIDARIPGFYQGGNRIEKNVIRFAVASRLLKLSINSKLRGRSAI